MEKPYEINDKDIDSVIRWLKINDPERADRENAIGMLQDLHTGFHQMSDSNPELLKKLQADLQGEKS